MTPEGKVKKRVKEILTEAGAYYHMSVPTGYGRSTLDFLVCYQGRFIAIETKSMGKPLKPRQQAIAKEIREAWGIVIREHGYEDCSMTKAIINELR